MELHTSRAARTLICLLGLLVCASVPLAAQRGVDLLNADEVLLRNSPHSEPFEPTSTVRLVGSTDPDFVVGTTHDTTTYQYDDGEFENFAVAPPALPPFETEVAQRFEVNRSGRLVSFEVCFQRPTGDLNRSVVFRLAFYEDDEGEPGVVRGLRTTWESQIRRAGDNRCLTFSGLLAGTGLARGAHWVGIAWQSNTNKLLGEDLYTAEDPVPTDTRGNAQHATSVRKRTRDALGAQASMWSNPQAGFTTQVKAYGIRLVVDHSTHAPDPGPDPEPPAVSACNHGLCLLEGDRFRVRARYAMPGMPGEAAGTVAAGLAGAAGLFTFGGDAPELLVRMVDDCSGSGYWMLYAGAATGADYAIAIRDTMSSELKWFRARAGASIRDMAFACGN